MKIQKITLSRINLAAYNPRIDLKPDDPVYKQLLRSIDEFGCVQPLIWNRRSKNLVGGHQRLKILQAKGIKEAYVSIVDLPPEKEKALNIALNKISGDWDKAKLAELVDELVKTPEIDIESVGFDLPEADVVYLSSLSCALIRGDIDKVLKAVDELWKTVVLPHETSAKDLDMLRQIKDTQFEEAWSIISIIFYKTRSEGGGITPYPLTLTPTGILIGICAFDELTGSDTDLKATFSVQKGFFSQLER